jgi:transcriptional regulator with XRE-family HTH domain
MAKTPRQRWTYLENRRLTLRMTQADLAARVAISESYMSQLESGARGLSRNPELLHRLAGALNTTVEELLASRPKVIYPTPPTERRSRPHKGAA